MDLNVINLFFLKGPRSLYWSLSDVTVNKPLEGFREAGRAKVRGHLLNDVKERTEIKRCSQSESTKRPKN